jgi:hypothetical protein
MKHSITRNFHSAPQQGTEYQSRIKGNNYCFMSLPLDVTTVQQIVDGSRTVFRSRRSELSAGWGRVSLIFNLKNVKVNHRHSVSCVLVWNLMLLCQLQWRYWRMKSVGGLYALMAGKQLPTFPRIVVRPSWNVWPLKLRYYSIKNPVKYLSMNAA